MTKSFAAGCTTSISRMIVAASEVTKSLPKWFIKSLFLPEIQSGYNLRLSRAAERAIRAKTCPYEVRKF